MILLPNESYCVVPYPFTIDLRVHDLTPGLRDTKPGPFWAFLPACKEPRLEDWSIWCVVARANSVEAAFERVLRLDLDGTLFDNVYQGIEEQVSWDFDNRGYWRPAGGVLPTLFDYIPIPCPVRKSLHLPADASAKATLVAKRLQSAKATRLGKVSFGKRYHWELHGNHDQPVVYVAPRNMDFSIGASGEVRAKHTSFPRNGL